MNKCKPGAKLLKIVLSSRNLVGLYHKQSLENLTKAISIEEDKITLAVLPANF